MSLTGNLEHNKCKNMPQILIDEDVIKFFRSIQTSRAQIVRVVRPQM